MLGSEAVASKGVEGEAVAANPVAATLEATATHSSVAMLGSEAVASKEVEATAATMVAAVQGATTACPDAVMLDLVGTATSVACCV
jgi:hypothetical protein